MIYPIASWKPDLAICFEQADDNESGYLKDVWDREYSSSCKTVRITEEDTNRFHYRKISLNKRFFERYRNSFKKFWCRMVLPMTQEMRRFSYVYDKVHEFNELICRLVNGLYDRKNGKSFIRRYCFIKKIYVYEYNKDVPYFFCFMHEKLFSYMQQEKEIVIGFQVERYLSSLFEQTELNKELCKKEFDNQLSHMKELYHNLEKENPRKIVRWKKNKK